MLQLTSTVRTSFLLRDFDLEFYAGTVMFDSGPRIELATPLRTAFKKPQVKKKTDLSAELGRKISAKPRPLDTESRDDW
jgi:hypothetical protein